MLKTAFAAHVAADLEDFESQNPGVTGAQAHALSIAFDDGTGITYLVTGDNKFRMEVKSALAAVGVLRAVANARRVWCVFPDGTRILQASD